ncbi:MAG: N-acetyl-gamma-glutamyl-phosphate reductase [Clostridium sp.]|uniref:N-acetyl-gamma-glutamyl-phosphate reductase n=1 Tax=Clostridium sp. TaxID=1506 RepID=UPI003F2DCC4B
MFKVGIIGATGYVGCELLRLLLNHPKVTVSKVSSTSFEGQPFSSVYKNFLFKTDLICENIDSVINDSDVIFTALPHGLSEEIAEKAFYRDKLCIDLGADFRLSSEESYKKWYGKDFDKPKLHKYSVYGLPELNKEKIKTHKIIANPGCYPTSIELPLLPLLRNKIIKNTIICDSKSGTTGAGRALNISSHYTEVNENFNPYKIGAHRHIPEIEEILNIESKEKVNLTFTPHLLPINRGILSTIYSYLNKNITLDTIHAIMTDFYKDAPFVNILPLGETAEIKGVRLSNFCNISLHLNHTKDTLIIVSAIDNMIKGAAGQAIQNMNIALGFEETCGLLSISPCF